MKERRAGRTIGDSLASRKRIARPAKVPQRSNCIASSTRSSQGLPPGCMRCPSAPPQEALRHLDTAFAHFYRRVQLKWEGTLRGKVGYPQRKSKKRGLGSFRLSDAIIVFPDAIQLPRLGRLRLNDRGYLPTDTTIRSATVSEQAGHWYVSVLVEQEQIIPTNSGSVVGVDLGVKALATLSEGTVIPNPHPHHLRSSIKQLKRVQRGVSRKVKG